MTPDRDRRGLVRRDKEGIRGFDRTDHERREAHSEHLRRTLTQTAVVTGLLGAVFMLTSNHTLHSTAIFLLAWSGGWAGASLYLFVRRLVKGDRRPGKS